MEIYLLYFSGWESGLPWDSEDYPILDLVGVFSSSNKAAEYAKEKKKYYPSGYRIEIAKMDCPIEN